MKEVSKAAPVPVMAADEEASCKWHSDGYGLFCGSAVPNCGPLES